MRFLSGFLTVAALLLPVLALPAHASPYPVPTRPAPGLAPGVWINGQPTTIADQKGKVVVLLFWTHGCINCQHNLGYWNKWAKKYRRSDVVILSVHTPETPSEYKIANVRRFVRDWKLLFPIVIDNEARDWRAYGIRCWPSEVLIDKQGRIRDQFEGEMNWQGSGEYKTVEARIEALRAEKT